MIIHLTTKGRQPRSGNAVLTDVGSSSDSLSKIMVFPFHFFEVAFFTLRFVQFSFLSCSLTIRFFQFYSRATLQNHVFPFCFFELLSKITLFPSCYFELLSNITLTSSNCSLPLRLPFSSSRCSLPLRFTDFPSSSCPLNYAFTILLLRVCLQNYAL